MCRPHLSGTAEKRGVRAGCSRPSMHPPQCPRYLNHASRPVHRMTYRAWRTQHARKRWKAPSRWQSRCGCRAACWDHNLRRTRRECLQPSSWLRPERLYACYRICDCRCPFGSQLAQRSFQGTAPRRSRCTFWNWAENTLGRRRVLLSPRTTSFPFQHRPTSKTIIFDSKGREKMKQPRK
jgi:hypothetical protein